MGVWRRWKLSLSPSHSLPAVTCWQNNNIIWFWLWHSPRKTLQPSLNYSYATPYDYYYFIIYWFTTFLLFLLIYGFYVRGITILTIHLSIHLFILGFSRKCGAIQTRWFNWFTQLCNFFAVNDTGMQSKLLYKIICFEGITFVASLKKVKNMV